MLSSSYTQRVLQTAVSGKSLKELAQVITNEEVSYEEAFLFVCEMADSQLLTDELEPAITGPEFIRQILTTLNRINYDCEHIITGWINTLEALDKALQKLDEQGLNSTSAYEAITNVIKDLGVPFEQNKLFQTDTFFNVEAGIVDSNIQQDLLQCIDSLSRFEEPEEHANLSAFAKRFSERYEDAELPLLQVVDTESGIGYLQDRPSTHIMPLIQDLSLPGKAGKAKLPWGKRDQFLFRKLNEAIAGGKYCIEINPEDLKNYKSNWELLPPSLAVMFRLTAEGQIYVESVGGSSAANLLGRFAHGAPQIHAFIDQIIGQEDSANPDVILAEITHLPESRIGNVLLHPAFRNYEIPFLARHGVDAEHTLHLDDLLVSVRNGRIVLRSARLGREIIPRLTTAHNFSFRALPVYQFLGDLQFQGVLGGIHFQWGALGQLHKFLPRVTIGNCVVHAATWNFKGADVATLLEAKNDLLERAQTFCTAWKLPKLVVLADSDNELLVNFEDELMLRMWLDAVHKRPAFVLREWLQPSTAVRGANGETIANQFVAALVCDKAVYSRPNVSTPHQRHAPLSYSIGSEWVYFKLYCGVKNADLVLTTAVLPIVEQFKEAGQINGFFFIRYSDPHFHLRIRFQLNDADNLTTVLTEFTQAIQALEKQGIIWKTQMDSYCPELDRYGVNTITHAEALFFHDSLATLQFLSGAEGDEREAIRWLFAMRSIDTLLDDFGFPIQGKMDLLQMLKDGFHQEFASDKALKEQLTAKYRSHRASIEKAMGLWETANPLLPWKKLLDDRSQAYATIIQQLLKICKTNSQPSLPSLLSSYIHMLVNRVVADSPRLHELVIYDFLYSYYRSVHARQKGSLKPKQNEAVPTL